MRIPIFSSVLFLTVLLGHFACHPRCEPFDDLPQFEGLENMEGVEDVNLDFLYTFVEGRDVPDSLALPRMHYVTNAQDFQNLMEPLEVYSGVQFLDSIAIDFENRTLVWWHTIDVDVRKAILKNGDAITFVLKIQTSHFAAGRPRMNAVTIPRINDADTVIFDVGYFGCRH